MKIRLAFLSVLLCAVAAGAQTPFATGDVLVLQPGGGLGVDVFFSSTVTVIDANGDVKSTLPLPPALSSGNTLLAQGADRLWSSNADGVLLSRDAATITGPFLTALHLQRLAGIAPLRSGNLIVTERWLSFLPSIVEFTQSGDLVAVHALPVLPGFNGLQGFEPLADSCGVAWTLTGSRTVRVFDICEGRARPDLFTIPEVEGFPYLVRQLPGGEFLITFAHRMLRVTATGEFVATYEGSAAWLALTPDGTGFWWIDFNGYTLNRIDFARPNEILVVKSFNAAAGLTVVGEWRASLQPLPPAPPSRRRSVRR
jgi:hypothetical protein